jgi:hypothetical protein
MSHPWHSMPASLLAGRRVRMTLHRTRHASHDPAGAWCNIVLRTLLVDSLHPAHLAMTPTKTQVAPSSTRWRHSHRTGTPWPRGYGLAASEMPDARLEARLGAKAVPHARPARSRWPGWPRGGQAIETTGPALGRVASVGAFLRGRSPWGRASLRLRGPSHCETHCRIG